MIFDADMSWHMMIHDEPLNCIEKIELTYKTLNISDDIVSGLYRHKSASMHDSVVRSCVLFGVLVVAYVLYWCMDNR